MEVGRAVVVAVCEKFCRRIRQTDLMPAAALAWRRRGSETVICRPFDIKLRPTDW